MSVDWESTELRYGYNLSTIRTNNFVVLICDNCSDIYEVKYRRHRHSGVTLCKSCVSSNKAKKAWQNDEYRKTITNNSNECWSDPERIEEASVRSRTYNNEHRDEISAKMKQCWQNHEYRNKCIEYWNNPEQKEKSSAKSKQLWRDDRYISKVIGAMNTPEHRQQIRINSRRYWNNQEHRNQAADRTRQNWQNKEFRCKIVELANTTERKQLASKISKQLWDNPEYRNKFNKYWNDKNNLERASKKSKSYWKNKTHRERASNRISELWKNEEYRNKVAEAINTEEYKEKMAVIRANQPRVSNIQMMLYSILDDLGIKYYCEYEDKPNDSETIIGPYNFDCMIPRDGKSNLLIECQGDYWHSLKDTIRNDKSKATYIERYYPGYELKYLWEHEFYCKDRVIELLKYWLDITERELFDFNFNDIKIIYPCKAKDYKLLLSKYHYLPNAGRGGHVYGAYFGNELIAVCIFSSLVRQNIKTSGYKSNECLELSRFCIHPRYQKRNFGSWFISRCLKLLDEKYKLIISYCDTTFNHDGALYKACNFELNGIVKPDYWYVDENGWVMHKKTLYNRAVKMNITEKVFADKYGYRRIYGKVKQKFIYKRFN